MKKTAKKSHLSGMPAWALSLITLVVVIILMFLLDDPKSTGYSTTQIVGYAFCAILIISACFFICKEHPKSIWYTLVICNAIGLLGLVSNIILNIVDPDFSTPFSEIILWGGIFILSVIAAFVGAKMGRKKIGQA